MLSLVVALGAACGQSPEPAPTTQSATPQAAVATGPPRVVAVDPPNGATGIEPGRRTLSVTFDRTMDPEGWAWLRENPVTTPELLGEASFEASGRTNSVEAQLEPGRTYVLWLNHGDIQNFRDTRGVPSAPFRWTFTTRRFGEPAGPQTPER